MEDGGWRMARRAHRGRLPVTPTPRRPAAGVTGDHAPDGRARRETREAAGPGKSRPPGVASPGAARGAPQRFPTRPPVATTARACAATDDACTTTNDARATIDDACAATNDACSATKDARADTNDA